MSSSRRARTYTDSVVYSQSEIFFETTVSKEVPAVQWQTEWEEDNPSATQQPFLQCQVLRVNWKTREPGFDMESSEVKKRKWSEDGFCFAFKAKEIHPSGISSQCSKFRRELWSCKLSLEMVQGSDGKREDEVASSKGWWFYIALRRGRGAGTTWGFPYLSFPLHSIPGDFPLFFSLSLQIFFFFIQFSLSNFFDRSSSVSHFCRRDQQRITFHSPAIQVIFLLCGDVIFPSRAMAGSQRTLTK